MLKNMYLNPELIKKELLMQKKVGGITQIKLDFVAEDLKK